MPTSIVLRWTRSEYMAALIRWEKERGGKKERRRRGEGREKGEGEGRKKRMEKKREVQREERKEYSTDFVPSTVQLYHEDF